MWWMKSFDAGQRRGISPRRRRTSGITIFGARRRRVGETSDRGRGGNGRCDGTYDYAAAAGVIADDQAAVVGIGFLEALHHLGGGERKLRGRRCGAQRTSGHICGELHGDVGLVGFGLVCFF